MYKELLKSTTLDIFYKNLINIWNGLDYVGISNEYLSFRYMDETVIIYKKEEMIDIGKTNEPIFIEKKYLKSNYVKLFFKKLKFGLETNKINWFDIFWNQETLINNNNNILIDLSDFIKKYSELSEFRYNSILLLSNKIDKLELMKKIYNIYHNRYNLEKFIKSLYRYRKNEILLNKCIENYNDADTLNSIYKEYLNIY